MQKDYLLRNLHLSHNIGHLNAFSISSRFITIVHEMSHENYPFISISIQMGYRALQSVRTKSRGRKYGGDDRSRGRCTDTQLLFRTVPACSLSAARLPCKSGARATGTTHSRARQAGRWKRLPEANRRGLYSRRKDTRKDSGRFTTRRSAHSIPTSRERGVPSSSFAPRLRVSFFFPRRESGPMSL